MRPNMLIMTSVKQIQARPVTLRMLRLIGGGMGSIIMGILGSLKIKVVLISRLDLMLQMMVRTVLVGMGVWAV